MGFFLTNNNMHIWNIEFDRKLIKWLKSVVFLIWHKTASNGEVQILKL